MKLPSFRLLKISRLYESSSKNYIDKYMNSHIQSVFNDLTEAHMFLANPKYAWSVSLVLTSRIYKVCPTSNNTI